MKEFLNPLVYANSLSSCSGLRTLVQLTNVLTYLLEKILSCAGLITAPDPCTSDECGRINDQLPVIVETLTQHSQFTYSFSNIICFLAPICYRCQLFFAGNITAVNNLIDLKLLCLNKFLVRNCLHSQSVNTALCYHPLNF